MRTAPTVSVGRQAESRPRRPTESYVTPLTNAEIDNLCDLVRERSGLKTTGFYGTPDW